MGKTLKEKLEQLSPERRKKIEAESKLLIAEEMVRQQLKLALKLTQEQMSSVNSSQMENRSDLMLSILQKCIVDMGGELRLIVEFPNHPPINILDISEIGELESKAS
ncbi:MAG: transcriptional regulator [Sphaerospermopsis sp. SIO1G2]|nr:transcriptional regulator [Sphaerospermopsis sp. SIO1G2]